MAEALQCPRAMLSRERLSCKRLGRSQLFDNRSRLCNCRGHLPNYRRHLLVRDGGIAGSQGPGSDEQCLRPAVVLLAAAPVADSMSARPSGLLGRELSKAVISLRAQALDISMQQRPVWPCLLKPDLFGR